VNDSYPVTPIEEGEDGETRKWVSDTESHILRMLIRAAIKIPSFGGLTDGRPGRINRPEENPFKFPR